MHDFEEELKGRFKEAASTEGVDADQLWAGIAAALPESPVEEPKSNRYRWLWLFLLLLLPLLFWLLPPGAEEPIQPVVHSETVLPAHESLTTSAFNQASSVPIENESGVDAAEQAGNTAETSLPQHSTDETTNLPSYQAANPSEKQLPSTDVSALTSIDDRKNGTLPFSPENKKSSTLDQAEMASSSNPIDPESLPATSLGEEKEGDLPMAQWTDRESFPPLERLEHSWQLLPGSTLSADLSEPFLPTIDRAKSRRVQWGVFTGLQFWSDTYANQSGSPNLGETLRDAYSSQAGYSVSLEVAWRYRPNLQVKTGVEYLQAYAQFNLVQSWDTVMYRDNVPGGELINALATRTVKHQNQQQLISIPLLIGTSTQKGRLTLGVNAGLGLNFMLAQSGKSLNSNEVITSYGHQEEARPAYARFFWSAQLQPYAEVQLTKGMALQVRPSIRWQTHGNSAFFGLKHQSFLSGLSVGVLF